MKAALESGASPLPGAAASPGLSPGQPRHRTAELGPGVASASPATAAGSQLTPPGIREINPCPFSGRARVSGHETQHQNLLFITDNRCRARDEPRRGCFGLGTPAPLQGPLCASVGGSGGVARAGGLGQQMPPWSFPSCPGLRAWNLTVQLLFLHLGCWRCFFPPAEAKAGRGADK